MLQTGLLENRQLAVLFCDIVDSTHIAQTLDAEAWRHFLYDFHKLFTDSCRKYGGHVHEYRGDGPLAYFGYPDALEDYAYNAAKAGIEFINTFRQYQIPDQYASSQIGSPKVRVSAHTGSAIIGEMNGRPTVTGPMLAFAERLQRVAPHNGLVVSSRSRKLLKDRFEFENLGNHQLKGFAEEQPCFLLIQEKEQKRLHSTFAGRQAELNRLVNQWQHLQQGTPEATLIKGLAGIGKSRLVREFAKHVENEEQLTLKLHCNQLYQNTPFYPVAQSFSKRYGAEVESNKVGVDSILSDLPSYLQSDVKATLEDLLVIARQANTATLNDAPMEKRSAIISSLVDWLNHLSEAKPLLLVIEDVDQIDPSSWEFITKLANKKPRGRLLILLTLREESQYTIPFLAEKIELIGVCAEAARTIIRSLDKENTLPKSFQKLLVKQCDGIPLYVEELAAMMLERSQKQAGLSLTDAFSGFGVPETIQGLLTVRLSNIGSARKTAQTAAIIGRTFSLKLLLEVSDFGRDELLMHIESLERARIIIKISTDDDQYKFGHALMSDAAYDSLVNSNKMELHKKIALAMEKSNDGTPFAYEILAHHFTLGGQKQHAIRYWVLAGQSCKRRSAQAEAIHHFSRALELIDATEVNPSQNQIKLKLKILSAIAPCKEVLGGYGDEQAKSTYLQAEQLALQLNDTEALLLVRFGLTGYYMMRGDFHRAYNLSQLCWNMAQDIPLGGDSQARQIAISQAAFSRACVLFHRAEFDQSIPLLENCLNQRNTRSTDQRKLRHDPIVMCHLYKAWYLSETGDMKSAATTVEYGVSLAKQANHPFGIAVALAFRACIHFFNKEYLCTIKAASQSIAISEEPGFLVWLAWAKVLRGRARSELAKERTEGIAEIEKGLQLWEESGSIVTRPFALTLLAESYLLDHKVSKAHDCIKRALETVEQFGERYYLAEILRVSALVALNTSGDKGRAVRNARKTLLQARDFAMARGMQLSVLKTTISLSQLNWEYGREHEALIDLKEACTALTPYCETADVKYAMDLMCTYDEALTT